MLRTWLTGLEGRELKNLVGRKGEKRGGRVVKSDVTKAACREDFVFAQGSNTRSGNSLLQLKGRLTSQKKKEVKKRMSRRRNRSSARLKLAAHMMVIS